jgi:hypothetical protein
LAVEEVAMAPKRFGTIHQEDDLQSCESWLKWWSTCLHEALTANPVQSRKNKMAFKMHYGKNTYFLLKKSLKIIILNIYNSFCSI